MYLAWNFERSPEGFVRTTSQQSWQNPYKGSQRKPLTSNVIIAGMALIIVGTYLYPRYLSGDISSESLVTDKSIAVLPFVNLSDDPEQGYFAYAIKEEIVSQLTKIKELRIRDAGEFDITSKLASEIGNALGVAFLLKASVRISGKTAKIIPSLIDVRSGDIIWQESFDSPESIELPVRIARKVASKLSAKITPDEQMLLDDISTRNMVAYNYYLRGTEQLRSIYRHENSLLAMDFFRKAINEDSSFYRVYGGLLQTMAHQHLRYGQDYSWLADSTLRVLDQVLSLQPRTPHFLTMKCFMLIQLGRYQDEERVLKQLGDLIGTEADPIFAVKFIESQFQGEIDSMMEWAVKMEATQDEHQYGDQWWYGLVYMWLGEFAKAETFTSGVMSEYELLNLPIVSALFDKDFDTAMELVDEMISLNPFRWLLQAGEIAIRRKDYVGAISYLNDALKHSPSVPFSGYFNRSIQTVLAFAYTQMNEPAHADSLLQRVRESDLLQISNGEQNMKYRYDLASGYAVEGDTAKTLEWLEDARKKGLNQWWLIEDDPIFDIVRNDPRYQNIIGAMKAYIEEMRVKVRKMEEARAKSEM